MSVLAVQRDEKGVRAAVLEGGRLLALRSEGSDRDIRAEQVYLAVCDRFVKGLNAVFMRLPGGESGFLPRESAFPALVSGQSAFVQVKRAPSGEKKAFLTRDIALAGQYLLLLPCGEGVSVSKRVTDEALRFALRARGQTLIQGTYGLVMRDASREAKDDALRRELDELLARWQGIKSAAASAHAPALLWGGESAVTALIREEGARLEYALTNDMSLLPPLSCPVRTADSPFTLLNVEHQYARARRRTVLLKSGASLVIDRCEAMTVIDVNSAAARIGKDTDAAIEKINLEAARECARLLRLLEIGGMILIDFIDMRSEDANARLLGALREALGRDPVKTVVHDITALGIVELTRRRADAPPPPLSDIPCPYCHGTGVSPQADTFEEETPNA